MTTEQTPGRHPDAGSTPGDAAARAKSDEMRTADVANGENPDADFETAAAPTGDERSGSHDTGRGHAATGADNDVPA